MEKTMKVFTGRKILIIVENLPCPFDRRVWQEALALNEQGATVSIICPARKGYEKKFEILENIAIYRYPLICEADGVLGYLLEYSCSLFWQFVLSLKCLLTRGFDVLQLCNPPDLLYIAARPFKLLGKKVVFDHHDINPELYLAKYNKKNFLYRLLLYFEKKTFAFADVSIATNNSYREIAITRGGKKHEEVFVVRSCPSLDRMKIVPPVEALKKGRKFLVGYVGVMGKQEGLHYLVEAAEHIIKDMNRSDIHFICVGDGTELADITGSVREKGLEDFFTFTGRVCDQEMLEALNTSDVCVNPDEYNEMNDRSTMNKIMEYMALGKPIVQFDMTEGRFSAKSASLYAEPNNSLDLAEKILSLLDNEALRAEMSSFGRQRIEKELNWDLEKKKLIDAYKVIFAINPIYLCPGPD